VGEKVSQGDLVRSGFWTGAVDTPFINVSIVAPGTRTVIKHPADEFGPEVKGLKARISLAKQSFEFGEPIETTFTIKNVSDERQIIWHSGFWPNHKLIVRDGADKEPQLTAAGSQRRSAFSPGGERDKNAPWEIAPGGEASTEGHYDLTKLYDLSKPGHYIVQCIYEERQTGWQGRLASNEAAFEIEWPPALRDPIGRSCCRWLLRATRIFGAIDRRCYLRSSQSTHST
jgi:hypothetical protein